eukprot:1374365-Rhodomonas_salina.1
MPVRGSTEPRRALTSSAEITLRMLTSHWSLQPANAQPSHGPVLTSGGPSSSPPTRTRRTTSPGASRSVHATSTSSVTDWIFFLTVVLPVWNGRTAAVGRGHQRHFALRSGVEHHLGEGLKGLAEHVEEARRRELEDVEHRLLHVRRHRRLDRRRRVREVELTELSAAHARALRRARPVCERAARHRALIHRDCDLGVGHRESPPVGVSHVDDGGHGGGSN